MKIEGNINFPEELPARKEEKPGDEEEEDLDPEDNEEYMQELFNQQEQVQR
jgi:hypothetical protein